MANLDQTVQNSAFSSAVGTETIAIEQHPVLIVDNDAQWATAIETRVNQHPRLVVMAVTGTASQAFELLERAHVSAIILTVELNGMTGIAALPEIRAINPHCEVILLSRAADSSELASRFNVFGAVSKYSAERDFDGMIGRLAEQLDHPNSDKDQRRTGPDRRLVQDWQQVTSQRRQAERRELDLGFAPELDEPQPPAVWDQDLPPEKGFY
ncbi:MAG: response regulator [Acidimicrobiales bacterium]